MILIPQRCKVSTLRSLLHGHGRVKRRGGKQRKKQENENTHPKNKKQKTKNKKRHTTRTVLLSVFFFPLSDAPNFLVVFTVRFALDTPYRTWSSNQLYMML